MRPLGTASGAETAPRISIVIDNHNYARFLPAAIDSALAQTHPHTETIVVDDGSTDDSRSVIAAYGDRVRGVFKPNGGQASAVNAGFAECNGDVVIFLDADDSLAPGILEAVAEAFRENPGAARVQYRLAVTDADGQPTGELVPADYVKMPSGDLGAGVARFNNLTWWPPTSGHAFSARTLQRILPMPEEPFRVAMDYYLVRASALCGPVVSLDVVGATYRRHGANDDLRDRLDLDQVRAQIRLIGSAHPYLRSFAESLRRPGFPPTAEDVADLRYVALRMISRKLDPARHPVPRDTLIGLAARGIRVAGQQTHQPLSRRCLAGLWFLAVLLAPTSRARELGEKYAYPETRRRLNRFLRTG